MIRLSAQAMTPKKIAEVTSHQRRPGLPVLEIQADVEAGGVLDLLPEPTVAVRGCPAPDGRACRGGGRRPAAGCAGARRSCSAGSASRPARSRLICASTSAPGRVPGVAAPAVAARPRRPRPDRRRPRGCAKPRPGGVWRARVGHPAGRARHRPGPGRVGGAAAGRPRGCSSPPWRSTPPSPRPLTAGPGRSPLDFTDGVAGGMTDGPASCRPGSSH